MSFSNAWKWKVKVKSLSCVRLLATSWTAAYQAPPSVGFSRQKYWSGVPLPSPAVNTASLYSNVRSTKHFAVVLLLFSHSVMSNSLWPHELQLTRLLYAWDSPDKNTGVGCHFLLQGIFLTQGSNLHCLQVSCIAGGFFTTEPLRITQ